VDDDVNEEINAVSLADTCRCDWWANESIG
jgi:hypothetical protein